MADTILTGIFGTLIIAILVYIVSRIDHLSDRIEDLAERVSRIEGRLDEREHHERG